MISPSNHLVRRCGDVRICIISSHKLIIIAYGMSCAAEYVGEKCGLRNRQISNAKQLKAVALGSSLERPTPAAPMVL